MSDSNDPVATGSEVPAPRRGAFVRDSATIALGQYVARAMMLARGWGAAIALGPAGYGTLNALNLILDYGSYAGLGALEGLDLRLPGAVGGGDRSAARRLMAGAWAIMAVGGVAFALIVAVMLTGKARPDVLSDPRLGFAMLAAVMLQLAFKYLAAALRAHGRFGAVSAGQSTQAVLGAGSGLVLVWSFGLWGVVLGWVAGTLVAIARMGLACPEAPRVPAHAKTGASLARLGFPIFAFYGASLVLRSVDRLALVRYGDAAGLGMYSVAVMAAGLVLFIPESVAYVLFPRIAAAHHGAIDRARVRADVLRAQRGMSILMPIGVGLAMIWAGPVIGSLLPAYRAAVPALQWLAAGALALSAATIPSYFLLGCGRQKSLLGLGVFAAAANAALVFGVAARHPEPVAVAAAASGGYLLFALVILARAAAEFHDRAAIRAAFALVSLGPACAGIGLAYAAVRFIPGPGWVAPVAGSAMFLAGYLPLALAMARGLGMRTLMRDTLK